MILTESFEKTEALAIKHRIWPMAMDLPQCRGLSPAGNKAPRSRSLTPPPRWDREEKIQQKKLVGQDKDREGSLTTYGHRQNRLNFGEK